MNITDWLALATQQLKQVGIQTARLDAELILASTILRARTYLHAHPEKNLSNTWLNIANARLQLRQDRVPLAYILGYKEFYGRNFKVTPATLIPRPESESIIESVKKIYLQHPTVSQVIDIGTGSGALGVTIKKELPLIKVTLSDISPKALEVAKHNAHRLGVDVIILEPSDLLSNNNLKYDIIIANLPYVSRAWDDTSPELKHEPSLALYAKSNGLDLIFRLLDQAGNNLNAPGFLVLEADPSQHEQIINYSKKHQFEVLFTDYYCVVLRSLSKIK